MSLRYLIAFRLSISGAAVGSALVASSVQAQTPPAAPASAASSAASRPSELKRVEITGNGENDRRRASTAAKIIVNREEIEKYGDSNVGEVLKRLPGITQGGRPGRGGDIRMRGLGRGYTLILLNGERMPAGFSLESLTPEQIERIEILRAPTAEYGARAIAGTINIVLREALDKRSNDVKVGTQLQHGRLQPGLSWTRNDRIGESPGSAYTMTLSVYRSNRLDDINIHTLRTDAATGAPLLDQQERGTSHETRSGLHFNSRIQLRVSPADTWTLTPFLVASRGETEVSRTVNPPSGFIDANGNTQNGYAAADGDTRNRYVTSRLNAQWQHRFSEATRLDTRIGGGGFTSNTHALRHEYAGDGTLSRGPLNDDTRVTETSWTMSTKLSHELASEHSLVTGAEIDVAKRRSSFVSNDPLIDDADSDYAVSSRRGAVYLQDEWNPTPQWSVNAGLRWEGITTRSDAVSAGAMTGVAVDNRSSVWTPLLHAVWKPEEKSRDQIRVSLTRAYRPAPLNSLVSRYQPTTRSNSPTAPDRMGNAQLRPELSRGIDLAFEHYGAGGGLVSANLFRRDIDGLIRTVVEQRTLPGTSTQRWVAQPRNIGKAVSQGIELETKARLTELIAEAPGINLRINLSFFQSRVEGIPGPNNRLDQQPKGTGNIGGDYRLRGWPLMIGGNVNYTPAYTIQQTAAPNPVTTLRTSVKRSTELFVQWTISPTLLLRVSAADLPPRDYETTTTVTTDSFVESAANRSRTHTNWTARFEMGL